MASINLSGVLLDPTGEFAVGDNIRFTHKSTTGETVEDAISVLTIGVTGAYNINLEFGLVLVEYKDVRRSHYKNLGVATVNGTNPATSIPELLNALVPVSSAELIEFQAILADCVTAQTAAELARDEAELAALVGVIPFDTVADYKNHPTILSVGRIVYLKDRGTEFEVIAGTGTANNIDIIASTSVSQSIDLILDGHVTLKSLGCVKDSTAPADMTVNSVAMIYAVANLGGFTIDAKYFYDQSLPIVNFTTIKSDNIFGRQLHFEGLTTDWAMEPVNNTGVFECLFENFSLFGGLSGGLSTRKLLDMSYIRDSIITNVQVQYAKNCLRLGECWNNLFTQCVFSTRNKADATTVAVLFDGNIGNVNSNRFVKCRAIQSGIGYHINGGGAANEIIGGAIENNYEGWHVSGVGFINTFLISSGCYIENNSNGNFVHNKSLVGSGTIRNVSITDNFINTIGTSRSGLIEFRANNGGTNASYKIRDNSFKNDGGDPTTGYMLDVNGAASLMTNIFIDWYNNAFEDSGSNNLPFDGALVDWRVMNSDVEFPLTLNDAGDTAAFWLSVDNGKLAVKCEDGTANLKGIIEKTANVTTTFLDITDAMPDAMRPSGSMACSGTISGGGSLPITMGAVYILSNGKIRIVGVAGEKYTIDVSWPLKPLSRRRFTDTPI